MFVRLYGATLTSPTLVGTVYVPHRQGRRTVLSRLPQEIASLKEEFPGDPLILMGDFNMELHDIQQEMARWPIPLQALANYGGTPTTTL